MFISVLESLDNYRFCPSNEEPPNIHFEMPAQHRMHREILLKENLFLPIVDSGSARIGIELSPAYKQLIIGTPIEIS